MVHNPDGDWRPGCGVVPPYLDEMISHTSVFGESGPTAENDSE